MAQQLAIHQTGKDGDPTHYPMGITNTTVVSESSTSCRNPCWRSSFTY